MVKFSLRCLLHFCYLSLFILFVGFSFKI